MTDVLTPEVLREAFEIARELKPRCWDEEAGRFRHVVSPTTLRRLVSGEQAMASCVNCGAVIAP